MPVFDEAHVRERIGKWEQRVDKEFSEIVKNLAYEGLYKRTVLEPKVRQLCTISGLTVLNALPQLKSHIRAAFSLGAAESEVKEAIIQMVTYCGMPYVAQAFGAYDEVARELKGKENK